MSLFQSFKQLLSLSFYASVSFQFATFKIYDKLVDLCSLYASPTHSNLLRKTELKIQHESILLSDLLLISTTLLIILLLHYIYLQTFIIKWISQLNFAVAS